MSEFWDGFLTGALSMFGLVAAINVTLVYFMIVRDTKTSAAPGDDE